MKIVEALLKQLKTKWYYKTEIKFGGTFLHFAQKQLYISLNIYLDRISFFFFFFLLAIELGLNLFEYCRSIYHICILKKFRVTISKYSYKYR